MQFLHFTGAQQYLGSTEGKEYVYRGEKFIVTKADACQMEVSGMGLTAMITIHTVTNMYRESLDGCRITQLCATHWTRMPAHHRESRQAIRLELCKGMDAFYGKLGVHE